MNLEQVCCDGCSHGWLALLVVGVVGEGAYLSPAIGYEVGSSPDFRAAHEVTARSVDVAVFKPPDEVEGLLVGNDGDELLPIEGRSDKTPVLFGRGHVAERMSLSRGPVEIERR